MGSMHIIIKNDHKDQIINGEFEYCVDHKCKKWNEINTWWSSSDKKWKRKTQKNLGQKGFEEFKTFSN